eukprot:XP_013963845.2 uncharacterized protein LOC102152502 isoform X5 [Canis lupus familiaris]
MVEVLWTTTCPGWGLRPWWGEALLASLCEPNRKGLRRSGHVKNRGAWAMGRGHYWETGARQHRRGWTRIHMDQMRVRRLIVPQTHVPLRTHHGQHRAVLRCLSALEPLYAHQAGSPVEPQEDADLSLCRVTDHHGFLQEKELPGPSPHEAKQKMPGDLESRQAGEDAVQMGHIPAQQEGHLEHLDIWNKPDHEEEKHQGLPQAGAEGNA